MSIRTLHINTERTWRGGEKQTLHLVRGLTSRGHVADLICPPGSPLETRARDAGVNVFGRALAGELNPRAWSAVRKILAAGYDICQMHTSHAHTIGVMARGFRSRPLTLVTRRVDFSIHRRGHFGLNAIKYRFGVDRYIAISNAIRDVMVRDGIGADRIEVVHSGVDPLPPPRCSRDEIRDRHGIPREAFVTGNVAHLATHKGQLQLVEALSSLRDRYPFVHAVFVGDGEERERLIAAAQRLGVSPRCHFVGFQEDVSSYLHAFDLFVMSSLTEGLCTSILDALLAALPVVASRTGGIPEIIHDGETGLLARPGDGSDFAAKIAQLIEDRTRAASLATAGRRLVEREFSVNQMVEGTIEVYERMLASTR